MRANELQKQQYRAFECRAKARAVGSPADRNRSAVRAVLFKRIGTVEERYGGASPTLENGGRGTPAGAEGAGSQASAVGASGRLPGAARGKSLFPHQGNTNGTGPGQPFPLGAGISG